jgi:predicted nucleotidyltransferase component of viral defense system
MLDMQSILNEVPKNERPFIRNVLREYLQHQILDIIYRTKEGEKLVFMGGTALRIVYRNIRFSEDLDFDNRGLNESDFGRLSGKIKTELEKEGYEIEIRNVFKGAYHCHIKFPGLLYEQGLTPLSQEKILIQLDAQDQEYEYEPKKFLMNRFSYFRYILTVPVNTLLSQKICALLGRKRSKGRDFFDVTFLFSKTEPDYDYLSQKAGITNLNELKKVLLRKTNESDMKYFADDVKPFLINQQQKDRVLFFKDFLDSLV